MHVLLIHQAFAALDEPGGTRHHEMARYLGEHGHRVTIIASPVSYLTGDSVSRQAIWVTGQDGGKGVKILRAFTFHAIHRSFFHRVLSFFSFMISSFLIGLGVRDIDLVWGTSPPIFQGATAWALARLKKVPFLFEVRDLWPAFAVAVGVLNQPLLIYASEWLEKFLYHHADLVVINSPGFLEHVHSKGAQRVELIPNGSDTTMFNPELNGDDFRRRHGLEGKFLALYAGAHGISNDLDVVLAASLRLQDWPDIAIVLLGDGKEKPTLMARARELGLTNLHFLPPIPKSEMPTALAAADACIAILKPIPMYTTVYPNKVFDYMSAGRPVVLAIGGKIQEVVEAASAGISVPPGDPTALAEAIKKLAANPKLRFGMGQSGRRYVEANFDRRVLASQLLSVMSDLANKV